VGRFFYTEESDSLRIERLNQEISIVSGKISRYDKTRREYDVPDEFVVDKMLYDSSGGDVFQEKFIRENFTRIDMLERILFKQIEILRSYEPMKK
jgi:hypothetical protein